jgi:hypothetical protein
LEDEILVRYGWHLFSNALPKPTGLLEMSFSALLPPQKNTSNNVWLNQSLFGSENGAEKATCFCPLLFESNANMALCLAECSSVSLQTEPSNTPAIFLPGHSSKKKALQREIPGSLLRLSETTSDQVMSLVLTRIYENPRRGSYVPRAAIALRMWQILVL